MNEVDSLLLHDSLSETSPNAIVKRYSSTTQAQVQVQALNQLFDIFKDNQKQVWFIRLTSASIDGAVSIHKFKIIDNDFSLCLSTYSEQIKLLLL